MKTHETPILSSVLRFLGFGTVIMGAIAGVMVCVNGSVEQGLAVIIGSVFGGLIYIGIAQAVDLLARSAYSTERLCTILETSITEHLVAIEKNSQQSTAASASFISANVQTPSASPALPAEKITYYYNSGGTLMGPVEAGDLRLMRKDGLVHDETPVIRNGETKWRQFRDFLALNR